MLLTGRFLVSIAWLGIPGGRYYWEHCHWVDTDDFSSNAQMGLAVLADMKLLYTTQVQFHAVRWYIPNTTTIHFQQTYGIVQTGSLTSVGEYTIYAAARWHLRAADDSYSYHLHRQPIGESYLSGEAWSTLGATQNQTRINTFIAQGIYRSYTGALLTDGVLAARVCNWGLRHGTKRRASRFWLP